MGNVRRTWPYVRWDPELNRDPPDAKYATPDCFRNSQRTVAGPLRTGTIGPVGPRGLHDGERSRLTDMGMDSLTPRPFDPMGTSNQRAPEFPNSQFVSRELRRR